MQDHALRALAVYLRPLPRRELLGTLAGLGVFVTEHAGGGDVVALARTLRADFALVVAVTAEDVRVVQALASTVPGGVVAILPAGLDHGAFEQGGVPAVLEDGELESGLALTVARVAVGARRARTGEGTGRQLVFVTLEFQEQPPLLRRGERAVPLSRSEREVLAQLQRAQGRPVAHRELLRCVSTEAEVHPGLLKAVVLRLRRKAAGLGGDPEALTSVRGFGYALTR